MSLSDRLNTTAVVKRKSRTSDSMGGYTYALVTTISSFSCRISMQSVGERFIGDKVDSTGSYLIFALNNTANAGIKIHDVVVDGSITYEIINIRRPSRGDHLEFSSERIDTE